MPDLSMRVTVNVEEVLARLDELNRPGAAEMLEANHLVNGDRQADYGTPRENYTGIAKVWSGLLSPILKRDITPGEAALMMVGLKLQRQAVKHKRDNLVDAHGYLLVYQHIEQDGGQLQPVQTPFESAMLANAEARVRSHEESR